MNRPREYRLPPPALLDLFPQSGRRWRFLHDLLPELKFRPDSSLPSETLYFAVEKSGNTILYPEMFHHTGRVVWALYIFYRLIRQGRLRLPEPFFFYLGDGLEINRPHPPSLCFSSERGIDFLVPDPYFLHSEGYKLLAANPSPLWGERQPTIFWRGTLNTKFRVDMVARLTDRDLFDVKAVDVEKALRAYAAGRTSQADIGSRHYISPHEFGRYQHHIDIDGFGASWQGFFLKLLSGVTWKLELGTAYKQWFYRYLNPGEHYFVLRTIEEAEGIPLFSLNAEESVQRTAASSRQRALELRNVNWIDMSDEFFTWQVHGELFV